MVAEETRKARAISSTPNPPTVLRLSATRASRGSEGWQHMKIIRSSASATD